MLALQKKQENKQTKDKSVHQINKEETSSQAPSYASPKLRLTYLLTGVRCRATSVAKNTLIKLILKGFQVDFEGI